MSEGSGAGGAIRAIYRALPRTRRRQAAATAVLMLLGTLAEVVSIGAVLPFLALLVSPERIYDMPVAGAVARALPPASNLVAISAGAFMLLFLASGALRLLLTWQSQALAFNASYDLGNVAFRKIIRQPYPFYVRTHSGELIARFEKIHAITYTVLLAGVQAVIGTLVASMLFVLLLAVDPLIALISAVLLVGTYIVTSLLVRGALQANSRTIATAWQEKVKKLQESLGGIRDLLIDRSQPVFEADYERSSDRLRHALTRNAFIGTAPRILIETIGAMLMGALAWYLAGKPEGLAAAIPTLGAFALGAQRMLPMLQQAYTGWSQFLGSSQSLIEVAEILRMPDHPPPPTHMKPLALESSIRFEGVAFAYESGPPVLRDIDFGIARGERIGIVGRTGAGKSSLMDLLLGLLAPTRGQILIDGVRLSDANRPAWQSAIAHVPQNIYLLDDSVAANIAFGVAPSDVDMARVERAADMAGIGDFVRSLDRGFETWTGERGARLSGGQRQRIGIARALYRQAAVLVFDEATSALDSDTEAEVLRSIAALPGDVTIVMIAHRLSTLTGCDRILCLERGRIARIVTSVAELGEKRA